MSRLGALRTMLRGCGVADSWRKLAPCDVLLVRSDDDCGYTFRSRAYSPLVDSIGELLSARGLRIGAVAVPYARWVGDRARFCPASYNRAAAATTLLSTVVRFRGRSVRDRWLDRRTEEQWSAILGLARPRCIIAINPSAVLCRVARRMGVMTHDLQHGVTSSYWYRKRGRDDFDPRDLPDGILCWDEASAAPLRNWTARASVDLRVIGNPWFSRFLRPQPDDVLVQEEMAAAVWPHADRPKIVVSLQWGLGTFYYPQSEFNGVMVDALEQAIATTTDRYNWLLRLHPIQMRGREQSVVERHLRGAFGGFDNVEWHHSSRMALPLVLSQADLHITDCSSVIIEAGWFGVRSAMLNPVLGPGGRFAHLYDFERSAGLMEVLPQDPESIRAWIARSLAAPRLPQLAPHYRDAVSEFADLIQERCRNHGTTRRVA